MSAVNDGGPAFPVGSGDMRDPTGLSLRDYFAARALQPFIAWALEQQVFEDYKSAAKVAAQYSWSAYLIADAMLAARGQTP